MENLDLESPQADMFRAWNSLHPLLTMLGKQFAPREGEGASQAVERTETA